MLNSGDISQLPACRSCARTYASYAVGCLRESVKQPYRGRCALNVLLPALINVSVLLQLSFVNVSPVKGVLK